MVTVRDDLKSQVYISSIFIKNVLLMLVVGPIKIKFMIETI